MAGRPRVAVDQTLFVNTITDAENEQTFPTQKALFEFVAGLLDIQPYIVANRVREWGIQLKTKPGKRGRPPGPNSNGSACKPAKSVSSDEPDFSELFAAFSGAGIVVKSSLDLLTSANKTPDENAKVKSAWSTLRKILDAPMPGK